MSYIATTTHTMVESSLILLNFSLWGSCFARQPLLSLTLLSLHHITKNPMWHCMRRPMRRITCSNVPALRKLQTHYSYEEMTLLPLLIFSNCNWKTCYLFGFWILNECICIRIRKVVSTKYLIGFIFFFYTMLSWYLVSIIYIFEC